MPIAENLCRLQKERGESNYRLAKELGCHATSVANWKAGKTNPSKLVKTAIANHYGITIDELTK